jgi:hypothetical protein
MEGDTERRLAFAGALGRCAGEAKNLKIMAHIHNLKVGHELTEADIALIEGTCDRIVAIVDEAIPPIIWAADAAERAAAWEAGEPEAWETDPPDEPG